LAETVQLPCPTVQRRSGLHLTLNLNALGGIRHRGLSRSGQMLPFDTDAQFGDGRRMYLT